MIKEIILNYLPVIISAISTVVVSSVVKLTTEKIFNKNDKKIEKLEKQVEFQSQKINELIGINAEIIKTNKDMLVCMNELEKSITEKMASNEQIDTDINKCSEDIRKFVRTFETVKKQNTKLLQKKGE